MGESRVNSRGQGSEGGQGEQGREDRMGWGREGRVGYGFLVLWLRRVEQGRAERVGQGGWVGLGFVGQRGEGWVWFEV